MNRNMIIGIVLIAILILSVGTYFILNNLSNNTQNDENNQNNNENNINSGNDTNDENNEISKSNTLVVYYSATGNTKAVSNKLAENLNADIFEIVPVDPYIDEDLNWTDDNSRVTKEHENESLRNIELTSTTVSNWENYDTVLIGYPIWWGIAAWPVNTFVKANDFTGKTVIPFCTSSSSGLGQSGDLLAELAGTGNWQNGHRFSSNPSNSEISEWANSLK